MIQYSLKSPDDFQNKLKKFKMMNPSTEIDYEMIQELLQGYYHLTPEILTGRRVKIPTRKYEKKIPKSGSKSR